MNTDDTTPSFGVPLVPRTVTAEEASPDAPGDEVHPELGVPIKDLNVLDAYWYELGMLASEDPRPSTPEEQERAAATYQSLLDMMSRPPEEVRAERQRRRARGRR